jgi:cell division protein FtsB
MTQQIQALRTENKTLSDDNDRLYKEAQYRKSTLFFEELSRTELGYSKPNETIVRLSEATPTPAAQAESLNSAPRTKAENQ